MPQGDLQAFFTGDVVAAAAADGERKPLEEEEKEEPDRPEVPPDFPPESFWLSKDAEFDWFDRNAFLERKESTKASSNSTNLNPNLHHPQQPNSNSQRFSMNLKSKASMIGLPKPQNTSYVDAKNRRTCKSGNIRLFPKRSGSGGKSVSSMIEPSSPKVSCMGRVRSKKDRNRQKNHRHNSSEAELATTAKEKPVEKVPRKGFFASFRAILRSGGGRRQPVVEPTASPPEQNLRARRPPSATNPPPPSKIVETEPPALGGFQRFASGRRSSSWSVSEAGIEVA